MIATPDLIESLAANMKPVRRLRPPVTRAACWLLLAAMVVALLAVSQGTSGPGAAAARSGVRRRHGGSCLDGRARRHRGIPRQSS